GRSTRFNYPSRRQGTGRTDIGLLAERRALVEHPIVAAAGQWSRRIVVLEDRCIGNPDGARGAGGYTRRPVVRIDDPWLTDHEAVCRKNGAVGADRPGEALTQKCRSDCQSSDLA